MLIGEEHAFGAVQGNGVDGIDVRDRSIAWNGPRNATASASAWWGSFVCRLMRVYIIGLCACDCK